MEGVMIGAATTCQELGVARFVMLCRVEAHGEGHNPWLSPGCDRGDHRTVQSTRQKDADRDIGHEPGGNRLLYCLCQFIVTDPATGVEWKSVVALDRRLRIRNLQGH